MGIETLILGQQRLSKRTKIFLRISPISDAQIVYCGSILGKAFEVYVMHHTCGSVYTFISDMIDCDLDILQSLQPEAANMAPKILKREFGDHLSFQGGISIQKVLPYGTAADVKEHVGCVLETMIPGDGYIACTSHNIQADTSLTNVKALFEAYHDFWHYKR